MESYVFKPDRTAMSRSAASRPLQDFIDMGLVRGRILHAGAGRQTNPDREMLESGYDVVHYDPHYGPCDRGGLRRKNFNTTLSLYVLNVLPPQERTEALRDLSLSVSAFGHALVAVRSKEDILKNKKTSWMSHFDGFAVPNHSAWTFQKGYTIESLRRELLCCFDDVEILKSPNHVILAVAKKPLYKVWSLCRGGSLKGKKYASGKIIGGKIYGHKTIINQVLPVGLMAVYASLGNVAHECFMYDPSAQTFRLDESPDFNVSHEPIVGDFHVFNSDGFVRSGRSDAIWHHKWQWVPQDYDGFTVFESECWSRYWYGRLERPASGSQRVWSEQIEKLSERGLFGH